MICGASAAVPKVWITGHGPGMAELTQTEISRVLLSARSCPPGMTGGRTAREHTSRRSVHGGPHRLRDERRIDDIVLRRLQSVLDTEEIRIELALAGPRYATW